MRTVLNRARVLAVVGVALVCAGTVPVSAGAGTGTGEAEPLVIGGQAPAPAQAPLPPPDSPPLLNLVYLEFPNQGNVAGIELQTYLYYMEIDDNATLPSQGVWTPFDEDLERVMLEDFQRLWDTGFLNDLTIEIVDAPFANGVEGKDVHFLLDERERVRTVTWEGSDEFDVSNIEEAMELSGIELRLESQISPNLIRRTEGMLRQMFDEKGFQFAEISHTITPVPGGPKLVQLAFQMDEGPKVQIDDIEFVGNEHMSDRSLKRQMKDTKERWWLSFITGRGTYKPFSYEQDAEFVVAHYLDNGYIDATVGQPELEYLDVSEDGKSRPVRIRIPVTEGERYRVGTVDFDGQEVVRREGLEQIFSDLKPGEYYSNRTVVEALGVAREAYGVNGYWQMTAYPDPVPRTEPQPEGRPTHIDGDPVVDVTIRFEEGEQFVVNRITFIGNDTTHDEVIRREINLVERGVFNTEALRYSVRRLNQLGYFEPLDENTAIQVDPRPGVENEVDLTLNLEEANLNQLSFGAGASQFDGFFLQLSFQTTNFLGRGESLTLSLQNGERIKNYNIGFTEPFLFGKPITGGINLFRRDIRFINQFTQSSIGVSTSLGFRVGQWSQMFMAYSYEETLVKELNPLFQDPNFLRFNPFLQDALALGSGGQRTVSKVTPTFLLNTVDHPIFPMSGKKYTVGIELAGLGGNTRFYKPIAEGIWFLQHAPRLSLGLRARGEFISPYGSSASLPIFSLLTMGGDFSLRGFDIRSIGPSDPATGLVIGGNKSLLFNAEYLIKIADPVRLLFFYDAGQVADFGQGFATDLFRTSTGIEFRFFMPVINVPVRLIYAWNPQREGILNDRFQLQEPTVFKFAMGASF
ncbi:MAG TPA: outer membrane protein assembly factor BamA [Vicinamibacterales bacterium]|nr:outer membrane protein assembly factor BamA [Vicinamibacterales bacterium]